MSVEGRGMRDECRGSRQNLGCWNNRSASTKSLLCCIIPMFQCSSIPILMVSGVGCQVLIGIRDISCLVSRISYPTYLASRITCSYWVLFGFRYSNFGFCFVGFLVR